MTTIRNENIVQLTTQFLAAIKNKSMGKGKRRKTPFLHRLWIIFTGAYKNPSPEVEIIFVKKGSHVNSNEMYFRSTKHNGEVYWARVEIRDRPDTGGQMVVMLYNKANPVLQGYLPDEDDFDFDKEIVWTDGICDLYHEYGSLHLEAAASAVVDFLIDHIVPEEDWMDFYSQYPTLLQSIKTNHAQPPDYSIIKGVQK